MSERSRLPNSSRWSAVGWMERGYPQANAARRINVFRIVKHHDREWLAYLGQGNTFPEPDSDELLYSLQTSPDSHWRAIQDVCSSRENEASDTINPILLKDTVTKGGTLTGMKYRNKILDPYVHPYASAIGNYFILMEDNARPHRAGIVEECREGLGLERIK
ncbi:DDE_3 domain-containing protein [Trichonephila clavipes]|nr:DDE_3 domain-containing protein [Trichonephila clavipes]